MQGVLLTGLTGRAIRTLVLALFVLGLGSGTALALCEMELGNGCCCTATRQCPRPVSPSKAPKCCSPQDTTPPSAATLGAASSSSLDPVLVDSVDPTLPVVVVAATDSRRHLAGPDPPHPPLFTLHASLLI